MSSSSPFQIALLTAQDAAALEHSLQSLQQQLPAAAITVFYQGEQPELAEAIASKPLNWQGSLAALYQQALAQLEDERPCLLLLAGESVEAEALQQVLAAVPEAGLAYARVELAERIEVVPRLFWQHQPTLQGQVFVSAQAPAELPLFAIKAERPPFYLQAPFYQAWLEGLTENSAPDVLLAQGLWAFEQQNDPLALSYFERLAERSEQDFWTLMGQVMLLKTAWEMRHTEQVFEKLETYRQRNTALENLPGLWILRGVMARQVQEQELAIECFNHVLSLIQRPDFYLHNQVVLCPDITWKPLLGLAELHLRDGLYSSAFLRFQQVLEYLPQHDYVLGEYLKSAFFIRRYTTIKGILAQNPALRGFTANCREMLGLLLELETEDQHPDVGPQVPQLLEKLTEDAFEFSVLLELSISCLQHAQYQAGRQLLEKLSFYLPHQVLIWHNLAYTYFAEGRYAEAEQGYRKALEVNKNFPESRFDLAKTLVMQGRSEEAQQELEHLIELHPRFLKARQALLQLQQQGEEQFVVPSIPTATAQSDPPFIFVFPLMQSWEFGLDLALKAYYQEFIAEDNVLLAVLGESPSQLLEEARQWAESRFTAELLPPVALIEQPLPLLPEHSAWLLPWRLAPNPEVQAALHNSGYPVISSDMQLANGQPLPYAMMVEAEGEMRKVWREADLQALQQQMRLVLESPADPLAVETETTTAAQTHDLLDLLTSEHPQALSIKATDTASAPEQPSLSVCMIVRNEAAVLKRCLDSVHEQVAEIIVVDTGSTDSTPEIAQSYAKVRWFETPWTDDFAAARNVAFEHATQDWVLFLDADEFVDPDFVQKLMGHLTADQQPDAYCFKVLALQPDGGIDETESLTGVPRMFPNDPAYRFEGRIHEVVYHRDKSTLKYFLAPQLPIYHVGYQPEVVAEKQKSQRDRKLMLQAIAEAPEARSSKRLYGVLARDYLRNGETIDALNCVEKGLQLVHDDPLVREDLFFSQQLIRLELGQTTEAIAALSDPAYTHNARYALLLSQALAQTHQLAKAREAAENALLALNHQHLQPDPLGLNPSAQKVLQQLAHLAEQQGEWELAHYYFKRLLKQAPTTENWRTYERLQQHLRSFSS